MANINYVVVGPGPTFTEVQAAVDAAIEVLRGRVDLHAEDQRAAVRVIRDPRTPGGNLAQLYYAGIEATHHQLPRRLYDALVANTDWDLSLDAEDPQDRRTRARS
jgi:hypothetical protein